MSTTVLKKVFIGAAQVIAAVAVVSAIILLMLVGVEDKWLRAGTFTGLVFGFMIWTFWEERRFRAFWPIIAGLFFLHAAIYLLILWTTPELPLLYWGGVSALEMALFGRMLVKGLEMYHE